VALTFAQAPDPTEGPSVVNDDDGIEPNSNAIYASLGGGNFQWFSNSDLGVTGDWVIRAVVDCQAGTTDADVAVAMVADPVQYIAGSDLTYTITIDNAGPRRGDEHDRRRCVSARLYGCDLDLRGQRRSSCAASGNGTIAQNVVLPADSAVIYTVHGIVAPGTTGTITNSATAVVGAPATDPDTTNNTATLDTDPAPADDVIFADGFDAG
jgi:hypothetical protein